MYALQIYFLIYPCLISHLAVTQHMKHKGPPLAFVLPTHTHQNSTHGSKIHLHTHVSLANYTLQIMRRDVTSTANLRIKNAYLLVLY
jgi:hypothetical protein